MKITIERKSFIDALTIGGSMSGKSKTLPILDMAKITIKDKYATISSFDGEVAITLRTQVLNNEENTSFCIVTKDLLAILRTLKDDNVVLDINNSICKIEHSKGVMEIAVSDSDDFPTPSTDSESTSIMLKSDVLMSWVRNAKNFVEFNSIRPIMGGVYLYAEGNEIGVAATNAHKLYWDYVNVENARETLIDAILTSKAIDALVGMIGNSEDVQVIFSENNIAFKTSNARLLCRKMEGRYPAFKTIIPKSSTTNVEVSMDELKDAINRANLMSGMTHLLKFNISGFNMHIESCDFDFGKKNSEDVACSVDGSEITIGLNGVFLQDCLNVMSEDKVEIRMDSPSRPIMFKEENKTVVLMPMKIS